MKNTMKKLTVIAALAGASALPAQAGTQYTGESAAVRVDQTSGTRIAAATETIVYSPNWYECAGTPEVTVLIEGGETLVKPTEIGDTYSWTPTKAGLNTLKHQIWAKGELKDELPATFDVPAKVTVTDVANADWVAYTNETVKLTGEQPYTVEGNASVKVVYTAKDGYVFPDGKTALTTNFTASAATTTVTLTAEQQPVKLLRLSNVELVDTTTMPWTTNATVKVFVGENEMAQGVDGSFGVPEGAPLRIVYTLTDENKLFDSCIKYKTLWREGGIAADYAMTDADKKPVLDAISDAWVEGDDGREIALDTRSRIVVGSPNDVLPIAYSTNKWGAVDADSVQVQYASSSSGEFITIVETNENGYAEWMPSSGAYDKYGLFSQWRKGNDLLAGDMDIATIYYSTYFPLSWATPEHGTIAVTNEGVAISSPTNVLGYTYLNIAAAPTYTNADRYEFAGWTATTNNVAWTNIAEATTTIEMPNAETGLAANFQWKSNYNARVDVKKGETWQVFAGETYSNGMNVSEGAFAFGDSATFEGVCGFSTAYTAIGGSAFDFTNVTFRANTNSLGSGGAIFVGTGATGSCVCCQFLYNQAGMSGGGIDVSAGAELLLEDSQFEGNGSRDFEYAGALHIADTNFQADTKAIVRLRGVNTFKTAKDTIANEGDLVWDFTDHGEPLVETYANITNAGTLKIAFDTTLTNGVYTFLRLNDSSELKGTTNFTISNGSSEKVCEIGSKDWVYVGAKRFKIARFDNRVGDPEFTLTVEWGILPITFQATPCGATLMVGKAVQGGEVKVYETVTAQAPMTYKNYQFVKWQVTPSVELTVTTNDAASVATVSFTMPAEKTSVTAVYKVSGEYKSAAWNEFNAEYKAATNTVGALDIFDAKKSEYLGALKSAQSTYGSRIYNATDVRTIDAALAAGKAALAAVVDSAKLYEAALGTGATNKVDRLLAPACSADYAAWCKTNGFDAAATLAMPGSIFAAAFGQTNLLSEADLKASFMATSIATVADSDGTKWRIAVTVDKSKLLYTYAGRPESAALQAVTFGVQGTTNLTGSVESEFKTLDAETERIIDREKAKEIWLLVEPPADAKGKTPSTYFFRATAY